MLRTAKRAAKRAAKRTAKRAAKRNAKRVAKSAAERGHRRSTWDGHVTGDASATFHTVESATPAALPKGESAREPFYQKGPVL